MEKVELPIKTKIAAWIMILLGALVGGVGLLLLILTWGERTRTPTVGGGIIFTALPVILLVNFFFLYLGISLFKREGWAWACSVIILSFSIIVLLYGANVISGSIIDVLSGTTTRCHGTPEGKDICYSGLGIIFQNPFLSAILSVITILLLLLLASLFLLLFDKKNFWKIAT